MYYGEIKKCDIANGEGVRVSLFVSGCTHHCPGCFNADTWNFKYGSEYTDQTEKEILEALSPSYINGLTLLGGEPFEPENQKTLVGLLRKVRESYDRLIVLILTQKKKYSSNFDTQGMFSFEKERDIWDVEKLMQDVRELETEQIKAISNYLSAELCNKYYSVKET